MSTELEAAGAASLGAVRTGGKADLSGQPCRNCGEMVEERYCSRCGQLAASYHRPFFSLVTESISDSFALDGRIARTLPLLLFRPGVLTRRYTEGKRARYMPPFRLFLLSSLIFYFVVFALVGNANWLNFADLEVDGQELTVAQMRDMQEAFIDESGEVDEARLEAFVESLQAGGEINFSADGNDPAEEASAPDATAPPDPVSENQEIEQRVQRIMDNPRLFVSAIETWLPRLSLLLVPFTMLAMSLMYFWRRKVFVYDHAIHALNLHSWMYLAATLAILIGWLAYPGLAGILFTIAVPVYVTLSLRGAYQTGFIASVLRMLVLSIFWLFAVSILSVGVVIASALSV